MSRLDDLADRRDEISASHAVRPHAIRLLARHPLRATDAGQLAAAIVMSEDSPARHFFVCLDQRLAKAAELEGMRVLSDD